MSTIDQVDRDILHNLIDNARGLDIDVAAVLSRQNISLSEQELRGNPSLPFADYLRLQRTLNQAIRNAISERVGRHAWTAEEYEVLFYYMLGAQDLAGAFTRLKFFTTMFGDRIGNGAIHLNTQAQLAKLYIRLGIDSATQQQFAPFFLWEHLKLMEVLAWLIGQPIELACVELPFSASRLADQFVSRLLCPVSYDANGFGFYFAKTLLQKPVVRSLDEMRSFLEIFGAVFISGEHFSRPPLKQRIERILEQQSLDSGGMPSAAVLANALNMSEATMRRRLREGGSSFSEIKRACQMRLGKKLLAMPNHHIFDIAQQLGYQDVNAFRRAFRHASGQTPEGFRRSLGLVEVK